MDNSLGRVVVRDNEMSAHSKYSVDATTIAIALCIAKRAVERRAQRGNWSYIEIKVRGGKKRLYDPTQLPEDVKDAVQQW
ncbi:MAG: hypothetical protein K2Q97_07125 [Burkholderiaceae bacterium]|nr:hypothetical protein [Burkholderiaceae bacterium]